jgi:hypothetical protein
MDKHFKILRVSHIFTPAQMGRVMAGIPDFKSLSFREQMGRLAHLKVDNCEALSRELRVFGHHVEDVYFDLEVPQKKWAEENDVDWEAENWENNILLKQIEKIRPDILFFQKTTRLPMSILVNLKSRFPFLQKIVLHTAYLGNMGNLGYVDLLLVGTPSLVNRFQRRGWKPRLFYHYFDPQIIEMTSYTLDDKLWPLTFLGSSGFGGGYLHADRFETLRYLLEKTGIEMWLSESIAPVSEENWRRKIRKIGKWGMNTFPAPLLVLLSNASVFPSQMATLANECLREKEFHKLVRQLPSQSLGSLYPDRCHSPVMGLDYYSIMARSGISFTKACNNIFDGNSNKKGDIGALRLFEATGLGSCLVADTGPNMVEIFEEGKEIVTYSSKEEAVEKINFLLSNCCKRKEIAQAGQARTLRDHTAFNRAAQFDFYLTDNSNKE